MSPEMRLMKTPRTIDIEITSKCNLRCLYCAHFSGPGDVKDLSTAEWLQFFDELGRCAVMDVSLSGGEPLLRKDFRELIEGIVRNRMRFTILTNGTLITEDIASFIASTGRCKMIQVSLDGSQASSHDACRGEGSFDRAVNGLRILKEHKLNVTTRVTIHHGNIAELDDIARFLLEDIGLSYFSTNAASSFGLCKENAQIQINAEERMRAMAELTRLTKKYKGRIVAAAGPLAEARVWSGMERARKEGKESTPGGGFLTGCNCVRSRLAVRSDGVIVPCSLLDHIELGRVNRGSLQEIWLNHPAMTKLRERVTIPLSSFDFCKGCDYVNYCTGSCPALAYSLVGKIDHPSPDICFRRFLQGGGNLTGITG